MRFPSCPTLKACCGNKVKPKVFRIDTQVAFRSETDTNPARFPDFSVPGSARTAKSSQPSRKSRKKVPRMKSFFKILGHPCFGGASASPHPGPPRLAPLSGQGAALGRWLHDLFPTRCLLCESLCAGDWCNACADQLALEDRLRPLRCLRCGLLPQRLAAATRGNEPSPTSHRCPWPNPPWDRIWVGMRYLPPVDGLLLAGKFGGEPHLCRALGRWLALRSVEHSPLVLAVPSTPERLRKRGYNPVEQIARGWLEARAKETSAGVSPNAPTRPPGPKFDLDRAWLRRTDRRSHQSRLGRAERGVAAGALGSDAESDAGFYLTDPARTSASRSRRAPNAERRLPAPPSAVTLLDDVMTTGSTLAAACRVLRRAGVEHINVVAVMRRA